MTLTCQRFTAVLLLIYGILFLSGIYYCLRVFWCAAAKMSELELESEFAKTIWRGKITFWAVSSQVMKHGSTDTTLKRSGKLHNGRLPIPHDQKKKIRRSKLRIKTILLTFFYIRGIVDYEFVPTGQ